MHFLARYY